MYQINDIFLGAILGLFGTLVGVFISQWFERRREKRDYSNWQLSNISEYYFEEYLSAEIKEIREKIKKNSVSEASLIEPLNKERQILSNALQRIGIMIFLGSIPLSYALIMNSHQIIYDWILIAPFIEHIRSQTKYNHDEHLRDIPYHRRHGEWLALITWLWLKMQPSKTRAERKEFLKEFETYYGSGKNIAKREKTLFNFDKEFVANNVFRQVKNIRRRYFFYSIFN